MKITMQTAKSFIRKYYLDTFGFMPMNKDIEIKDITDDIIIACINNINRYFKVNISVEDVTDRNLIAD